MSTSVEYKTTLACFDKLVTALKSDPVTVSNELLSENLIPPLDGPVSAQKLAQLLLGKIKVTPKRYYDVINVFSRHDWLKDIVEILSESNDLKSDVFVLICYLFRKLILAGRKIIENSQKKQEGIRDMQPYTIDNIITLLTFKFWQV